MRLHKLLLLLIFLLCFMNRPEAQASDTVAAQIEPSIENNKVRFGSVLRPLRQIAGAPQAFYTYFWEFGDGTYSFEKEPVHVYKDTGLYQVRLYATNNYDDGKKPPTKPRPVPVNKRNMLAGHKTPSFFKGNGSLEVKTNQMPKPGEEMVLLIGYRNRTDNKLEKMSGSIMFLYNEKQFSQNSFDIADVRNYYQEKSIDLDSLLAFAPPDPFLPAEQEFRHKGWFTANAGNSIPTADKQALQHFLKQEMNTFRKHQIWRVHDVQPGEEKLMFLSVNTLPEMIKDTNAVVTITALFIPDDPSLDLEKFDLELPVVASHDPNRISLKNRKLNYRFTGKDKDNVYKIRFQNTGKGPAKKVAITVTVPGLLNTATVDIIDMKPACSWCDTSYAGRSCMDTIITKDSIQFIFNNIYLAGMQQDGISDPDSTMGYIRYRIRFDKRMKKIPFASRAAIVFDKNEPVYTNRSEGKFRKGISPGIIVGNGIPLGNTQAATRNIGVTLSEYAAFKKYFQWELYLQPTRNYESFIGRRFGGDTTINRVNYKIEYRDIYQKEKVLSVEAVPLEFRYNLASFVSAGAGGIVSTEINRTTTRFVRTRLQQPNSTNLDFVEGEQGSRTQSFATWRGGLFADVQLGKIRVGPAAGLRYLHYFKPTYQSVLLYVSWKF
jgi:hypothetical protein